MRFVGAREFDESALRDAIARQLSQIAERGLKETRANDAAFFLELFYRRHGYLGASMHCEILAGGGTLPLKIAEGPMPEIARVDFAGNRQVTDETLHDYLIGATRASFSRFLGQLPFVEADIEAGVDRLRSFYTSQGFLHAQVEPTRVRFSRDKTEAFVTVPIHEGRQYFFGTVAFRGETMLLEGALSGRHRRLVADRA